MKIEVADNPVTDGVRMTKHFFDLPHRWPKWLKRGTRYNIPNPIGKSRAIVSEVKFFTQDILRLRLDTAFQTQLLDYGDVIFQLEGGQIYGCNYDLYMQAFSSVYTLMSRNKNKTA